MKSTAERIHALLDGHDPHVALGVLIMEIADQAMRIEPPDAARRALDDLWRMLIETIFPDAPPEDRP